VSDDEMEIPYIQVKEKGRRRQERKEKERERWGRQAKDDTTKGSWDCTLFKLLL
jgi:hypothetical protein